MGGPFTFRVAAAVPDRVGAIASFHGAGLVTDAADSPHASFPKMKAAALICIAQNDHERQPDAESTLEQAAAAAGVPAEIEVYPANHGWCALDTPVYDEAQAERAWARLLATYAAHL
jgi:carboxymethylenebutenolidase